MTQDPMVEGSAFSADHRFDPTAETPRHARRFVDEAVHCCVDNDDELCTEAVLLTSEVVTDAVRQAPSYVDIHVDLRAEVLRVEVSDDPGVIANPTVFRFERRAGRRFLEALTRRWGSDVDRGRTTTWFELSTERPD